MSVAPQTRRNLERLAEAAKLYYVEGLNQQQVADALGTTRSNVSRMLHAAREQHIVTFQIHYPLSRHYRLEQALTSTFGLADALVVSADADSDALDATGELAASWLVNQLQDGQSVGLSWGRSVQATVERVTIPRPLDIDVLQLGGDLALGPRRTGHDLIRDLAARLGGRYSYLHAPAILDSKATARRLMATPSIAEQIDRARAVDLALVGIGAAGHGSSRSIIEAAQFDADAQRRWDAARAVGDICARFYNSEGVEIDTPIRDRVLAVTLDDLKRIPRVAGVACGRIKAAGLLGALRAALIDVVICDQALASSVLHLERERREHR